MSTKITRTEKEVTHPLEEIFDIEENTTVVPYTEVKTDLVSYIGFDEKDNELESQLQNLYDMALEAFETQQDESTGMEQKFRARNAEVAAQYLKTALEAVREKRELKQHKDKIVIKQSGATTNNNLIVADHNVIMELIEDARKKGEAIEGDYKET